MASDATDSLELNVKTSHDFFMVVSGRIAFCPIQEELIRRINILFERLFFASRGNVTSQSRIEMIVSRKKWFEDFLMPNWMGFTARDYLKANFPNIVVLVSEWNNGCDDGKIVLRAIV